MEIEHEALSAVYEQYCNDGATHPIKIHYYTDGDVVDSARIWLQDTMGAEMGEYDDTEVRVTEFLDYALIVVIVLSIPASIGLSCVLFRY